MSIMVELMSPAAVRASFKALNAQYDEPPKTELNYKTPFTLLVAVVLSAQMTDKGVNKATAELFKKYDTPRKMLQLSFDELLTYIKGVNFSPTKTKNVLALSDALVKHHNGQVPHNREALEALPGVGRKTTNVVLNVVFGEPTMAVDTHVFRVSNRTGIAPGQDVRTVEDLLMLRIPKEFMEHAHHLLILHGRYICVARTPKCPICPIRKWCLYPDKTANLPPEKPLKVSTSVKTHAK